MRIAVVGAGFTGLSAAYELTKQKHEVLIFEKDSQPGGLAIGYKTSNWNWSLEKYYHHWFTNDKNILSLAREINYEVLVKRPKTCVFINNIVYQLDSPLNVLKFPLLSILERLRMGFVIAFLKYDPFWKFLEKYNASKTLTKLMGKNAYQMIWEPLFINKFGKFSENISLAWFWARIKKRTPSLAYPKRGFLNFANELTRQIEKNSGKLFFETEIINIKEGSKITLSAKNANGKLTAYLFDKVIITIPSSFFLKLAPQLPLAYKNTLDKLENLGTTSLLLRLKKPFFEDGTYWLNICDKNAPVMAIVEHTNFIDKINYGNEHLLYLGNYKDSKDKYFSMTKAQLLEKFDKYLNKIHPGYKKIIIDYELFKTAFAQPIISTNYSKLIPPSKTPLKNVFLANMEQVYPWDRGTNYAVELGQKISKEIFN
jgi:protoporphyrinogen oxidase